MFIDSRLKDKWHRFWYGFHQLLLKDCLDHMERAKIEKKIRHHESKIQSL